MMDNVLLAAWADDYHIIPMYGEGGGRRQPSHRFKHFKMAGRGRRRVEWMVRRWSRTLIHKHGRNWLGTAWVQTSISTWRECPSWLLIVWWWNNNCVGIGTLVVLYGSGIYQSRTVGFTAAIPLSDDFIFQKLVSCNWEILSTSSCFVCL